jgi:histidinol-phosphatase (PHP family)
VSKSKPTQSKTVAASKSAVKSIKKTAAPAKKPAATKPAPKAAPKKAAPAKKAIAKKPVAKPVAKKTAPAAKAPVKKPLVQAKKVAVKTASKAPAKKATPAPKAATQKSPPPAAPAKPTPQPAAKAAPAKAKPAKSVKAAKPIPAVKAAPIVVEPKLTSGLVVSSTGMPRIASLPSAPPPAPKSTTKKVISLPSISSEPIAPAQAPVLSTEKASANKSGALFYDSHMHTPLCKHAWGEPEEYAAQALKAGLKGIIFTCHCPMPDGYWPMVRMAESEFETYLGLVKRTADAYKGKLDVLLGLESEYFPGYEKWIEALHQRADFDYILGAVHWQAKEYLNKYETGTIEGFRRTYFEHLAQSAETGLYDCLAHPDLVKNYHPDSWCFAIIKNTVTSVLDRIAKTGVAMEINTSGLNKSYSEMNPGNEMLRMMAERNIPIVIGSDAHKAVRVGEHFVTALNNLSEAGYENVSYFKRRQRIDVKISEVISSIKRATDANA